MWLKRPKPPEATLRRTLAPGTTLATCVVLFLTCAALLVSTATHQPWLGLTLISRSGEVVVADSASDGPAAAVPRGAKLTSVAPAGGVPLVLVPNDVIEEPDGIENKADVVAFYDRQDRLHAMLSSGAVDLGFDAGGIEARITVAPAARRPLSSLPLGFWVQLAVAFTGLTIGAWLVILRPDDGAAWLFFLAGAGLAMSSGAAALYSSREVALAFDLFRAASRINSTGAMVFGIGMVTMFLIYPRRVVPRVVLALPAALIGAFVAYVQFVDWPQNVGLLGGAIAIVMLVLLSAILVQVVVNRRDPAARVMLGWLGISVAVGAGGFVLTSTVPGLLGQRPWLEQSMAFLFFLVIYAGMAVSVARYRLFDLATWSFDVLYYGGGVAILLGLDTALIYGLSLDRAPAIGISLAAVGLVYLPFRDRVAHWLHRGRKVSDEELFLRVTEIAHAGDATAKTALLTKFWTDVFDPLTIEQTGQTTLPTSLAASGRSLILHPVFGLTGYRLDLPQRGARLFSSRDLARAQSIQSLMTRSLEQHAEYQSAVTAERHRINRDMHDNIGVLLLGALHAGEEDRKNALIRQTLTDLREIISNPDDNTRMLPLLAADLRREILEHLEAADIAATWRASTLPDVPLGPQVVHTLRALLREGTSNIVRHSGAAACEISLSVADDSLSVSISDNGSGFATDARRDGNGIRNLTARLAQVGGSFAVETGPTGTVLRATLPLAGQVQRAAQ